MRFTTFQNKKNALLGYKKRSSKSRKIEVFPKGLNHGFGQKLTVIPFFQAIQALKTRRSKRQKTEIFLKGLVHGFDQKLAIFPSFFQQVQAKKLCFAIFQNEKTPFQPIKTTSSKSRTTDNFLKGLLHGFGQELAISPSFFRQFRPRKSVLRYSRTKKSLARL